MKTALRNWWTGISEFLLGEARGARDRAQGWLETPTANGGQNTQATCVVPRAGDGLEEETASEELPLQPSLNQAASSEVMADPGSDAVPPARADASAAPEVTMAPDSAPPLPMYDDTWLHVKMEALRDQVEKVDGGVKRIEAAVGTVEDSRRLLEDQEKLIQGLTARLREAEEAQTTRAVLGPVVMEMIQLFDTVWGASREWQKGRPVNVDEWITNCLGTMEGEIVAMLNRHGVTVIQDTPAVLNPAQHRVVETQTVRQVRDGEVLRLVQPGFVDCDRVVRPAGVVVARTTQGGVR